ncbi:hypothetical protein BTO06_03950 [Tenacibaculum sp. SZ-18]|uniref:hypothetical protein n=1 Tax=Tenacibaculum sp. SZ-18 TaxID=754423 RepID=UPI000C2D309A|nr:hypothetical protein [Tenacibaculum sp. SZ-18]AUC14345.1 hypothetical protein BTO06_03950 [Tenacibaculum sp. SZ-18]
MKLKVQYYTIQQICNLYDAKKDELVYQGQMIEANDRKFHQALYGLLDEVIDKFKQLLIKQKDKKDAKLTLKKYQAFFLKEFLLKNHMEFTNLLEQTLLRNLAFKIDEQL